MKTRSMLWLMILTLLALPVRNASPQQEKKGDWSYYSPCHEQPQDTGGISGTMLKMRYLC